MRYTALEYIKGGNDVDSIKGEIQDYEQENVTFALHTRGQYIEEVSSCMPINSVHNGVVLAGFGHY